MRRQWLGLLLAAPLWLAGCGQHGFVAQVHDRDAVLAACLGPVVRAGVPHDRHALRNAMGRIEACMAEQRLPGYAMYDRQSRAVRYAYEADQPVLRF
jgi:hypothetical protein